MEQSRSATKALKSNTNNIPTDKKYPKASSGYLEL